MREPGTYILTDSEGHAVSHYLTDGLSGRKGEPVEYAEYELIPAKLALEAALGVALVARRIE